MRRHRVGHALILALSLATGTAYAGAQQTPPVHPVGPIVAKTTEPIGRIGGIHVLSTGRVVVNDANGRRVLLFDSTLTTFSVLMDSSGATARKYPVATTLPILLSGIVIPFVGDSTVFYDPVAVALVVLDPQGRIARVGAPPFPPDAGYLIIAGAQFDAAGRAVYRGGLPSRRRARPDGVYLQTPVDSAAIVRATPGAFAPETLAYIHLPKAFAHEPYVTKEGPTIQRSIVDPFPVIDEWTMLHDGTIAIIRGRDYHIDWVVPGGERSSSPKLPFQWHRLNDSDKVVIVDSITQFNMAHPAAYVMNSPDGNRISGTIPLAVIGADSLGDYRQAFGLGAMLADADGNVWILPTPEVPLSPKPGLVYDVVNRAGRLIDRVQLGPDFSIVGFSPGYVFMSISEGTTTVLVKARIR